MTGPIVTTAEGRVQGFWRDGSAAFLGIPFAEPPVGELRFAAPVPRASWDGVRDATAYGPTPQRRPFAEVTSIPEPSIPGDDTLSVNVFTPTTDPGAKLPVLFWIHGGGYKAGSPASPWYDGFAFNRDGVVTVTVAYRLGFDGFGLIEGAPANRGLLDQVEGLRWVRRNIAAFGGDPGNVTIAGQSAGGGSVLALLASPLAKDLFHAAICHSGALDASPASVAAAATADLAGELGIEPTLAAFRDVPEEAILDASDAIDGGPPSAPDAPAQQVVDGMFALGGPGGLRFSPHADEASLPADWVAAIAADPRPLLMGCVAHEFTFFGFLIAPALGDADVRALLAASPLGDLVDEYAAGHPELAGPMLAGQVMTDKLFRRWVPAVGAARAAAGRPLWAYDFRWPNAASGLAAHCAELPFAWDNLADPKVPTSCGPDAPQALADAMHGAWVRFVTRHDPGWTPWRPDAPAAMVFDAESRVSDAYALERRVAARVWGTA